MNITDVLSFLAEERGVDYITKALVGKVPEGTVNALSSRMKKGKFDNEAMAIFKGIQGSANEAKSKYLSSHASMVYSILRKLKIGNSSFNADEIITDYIKSDKEPSAFWREKYNQANNKPAPLTKEQKRYNTPGLSTARFKDLGDCFAIIPKNYKKIDPQFDFRTNDLEKSHEEMKLLSNQMASKDTGEDFEKVNHWCVSASESHWYNRYKTNNPNGIFVIIVNKNKDGSPDWNHRYLAFFEPEKRKWGVNLGRLEIANKLDTHIGLEDLPKSAQSFIRKMAADNVRRNKPDESKEVQNRLNTTEDEREIKTDNISNAAKALFDYTFKKAREAKAYKATQLKSYLKRELKMREYARFQDMPVNVGMFWTKMAGGYGLVRELSPGSYSFSLSNDDAFNFKTKSMDEMKKKLDEFIEKPSLIVKIIDENLAVRKNRNFPLLVDKVKFSEPTGKMLKSLGGNRKIMDKYFSDREEKIRKSGKGYVEIFSPNSLKDSIQIYFGTSPKWWWEDDKDKANVDDVYVTYNQSLSSRKYLGKRDDPETLANLKEYIDRKWGSTDSFAPKEK